MKNLELMVELEPVGHTVSARLIRVVDPNHAEHGSVLPKPGFNPGFDTHIPGAVALMVPARTGSDRP